MLVLVGNVFFSSRRRHTRFDFDWSSDVCSSDLPHARSDRVRGRLQSGRRRYEHHGYVGAADAARRVAHRREYRDPAMRLAGAPGIHARHHARAVSEHLLGPEASLAAGDSLHHHAIPAAHDHRAAATAARTASSMRSKGSSSSRSRIRRTASSSPVPWTEKNTGKVGCSVSQARTTPSAMTSVRANAPQKLTIRLLTRGLASTSLSAAVALVYASPPISRKFAGAPP